MKIGIITFWESQDNYGQLLQAFALQKYLQKIGHDVFTIKYKRIPPLKKQGFSDRIENFNLKRFIKNRLINLSIIKDNSNPNIDRYFDSFREMHLNFSSKIYDSLEELKSDPPLADAYICGSDQVWNNSFSVSSEAFLLGFGKSNTKRIAYAASFGMKELPLETENMFQKYIHNFDAVSVREKSGLNICKNLGYRSAIWVPDPTMLFDKDQWLQFFSEAKPKPKKAEKRLFLYTLGNSPIENRKDYLDFVNNMDDTELYHVSANHDFSGNYYPAIPEWIHALSESDFVITNSFHGTLFSIIFNKTFVVLPNTGEKAGMNERVISLLEKLNLKERILFEYNSFHFDQLLNKKIDWEEVNDIIKNWKSVTDDFFKVLSR